MNREAAVLVQVRAELMFDGRCTFVANGRSNAPRPRRSERNAETARASRPAGGCDVAFGVSSGPPVYLLGRSMSSMAASSFWRAFLLMCEPRQTLTRLASCFMEYSCKERRGHKTKAAGTRAVDGRNLQPHPVVLDELLHVVLRQVVGLDVGLHKLLVGDGPQVGQLLQLHEELLEVQLHEGPTLVATFLHVGVAAGRQESRTLR